MAGLFGLGKTKYVDEPDENLGQDQEKKEAFFLDADEAKTLGNIEFMRQPNLIKRSFPKIRGSQGKKVVTAISSMEAKTINNQGITANTVVKPEPEKPEEKKEIAMRRSADSSMEIFRQMAKNIKK